MKKIEFEIPIIWEETKTFTDYETNVFTNSGLFSAASATVYSQATKFSFEMKNQRIQDVLREIEKNSEFRFFYQSASR
jgi:hypothetical protein